MNTCFLVVGPTQFRGHSTELLAVRCAAPQVPVVDLLGQEGVFTYRVTWADGTGVEFHTPITEYSSLEDPVSSFNWATQYLLEKVSGAKPLYEDSDSEPPHALRVCTIITSLNRGTLEQRACDWLRDRFGLAKQHSVY